MAKDVEVAIIHGAQNALGLFPSTQTEARVDRADGVVELPQDLVWIIERSIRKDVDFGGFQDAKAPQPGVQLVDEPDLCPQVFNGDPAGNLQAARMVRYADIFITPRSRRFRHFF